MKRLLIAAALALVVVGATAAPALAYGEPAGPSRVAPGGSGSYTFENIPTDVPTIDVSVSGPGDVVLAGLVSRTYSVSNGVADVHITFPVTGVYTLTGTGSGPTSGSFSHSLTVTAVVAPADARSGLPSTGIDILPYLWFGGGALALGVGFIVMAVAIRRRAHVRPGR
ncbi:hypothetical protein [Mesorhizobium japonicum]|uniref:hypothetical protein n=1 Tax=Mesorhizobium japonicum TaxID=2066070 RepID=UPI003B599958